MSNKVKNQIPCKHGYDENESIEIEDPIETIARVAEFCQQQKIKDDVGTTKSGRKAIYCKTQAGTVYDRCFVDASVLKQRIKDPFNQALGNAHEIFDFKHEIANVVIVRMNN